MNFRKMFILFLLLLTTKISAQDGAISSLLIPTSPKINSSGAAGTASLVNDPYKFFFNPAHLGYSSRTMNISSGFYPAKIDWFSGLGINSYVFNTGYNFQKMFPHLPLSVGLGYSKSDFNFGFSDKDSYTAYSLGIGYHTILNISAGFTIKDVESTILYPFSSSMISRTAKVTAMDYGFLINIPLNNLLHNPLRLNLSNTSSILTDIDYSLGYTIQNVGDKIYYIDPAQSDPIGRTARLAHNLQVDAALQTDDSKLGLINFSYSIDSEDILITRSGNGANLETGYQGLMGDIKFGKNLFLGKGDSEVVLHKGMMVEFFEFFTLAEGGFSGRGFDNRKTDGIGFRLKGLLKLVNLAAKSETVRFMIDHFDVEYFNTNYFSGHDLESEFNGMMITIGGF